MKSVKGKDNPGQADDTSSSLTAGMLNEMRIIQIAAAKALSDMNVWLEAKEKEIPAKV